MSASDEGEKNDALYGHCKRPFIKPQLNRRECVALTHGGWNSTSTEAVTAVPTLNNTSIDLIHTGPDTSTLTTSSLIQQEHRWLWPARRAPERRTAAASHSNGSFSFFMDEKVHDDTQHSFTYKLLQPVHRCSRFSDDQNTIRETYEALKCI